MSVKLLGDGGLLSFIYPFVGLVIAYIYPISRSCRAVRAGDEEAYHQWLTYWMVFFLIRLMEGIVDMFMSRVPFYREIKLAFITWLVLPKFKGASLIYHRLLHKYLEQYETDIDGHIVKLTHHAKQAAWEVSSTVVKETSGVMVRAASRLVMTPNGMALVQAAVATGAAMKSGDTGSDALQAIFPRSKLQSASLPAPVRVRAGSDPPLRQRSSSRLTSPVGASPSDMLTSLMGVLEDGMFLHLGFHDQPPSLHLLRLSADRRCLVYDDVASSELQSLRLVSLVHVRSGGAADQLDLLSLAEDQGEGGPPALQRLTIVAGSDTDRDALLAGFRLLLAKVREPYVKAGRLLRRAVLRHSLHAWAAAAREGGETKQEDWEQDAMDYK